MSGIKSDIQLIVINNHQMPFRDIVTVCPTTLINQNPISRLIKFLEFASQIFATVVIYHM